MPVDSNRTGQMLSDRLPPSDAWPAVLLPDTLPRYADDLNLASALLAQPGERCALIGTAGAWSYVELANKVNRVAGVLRHELNVSAHDRVLIHGQTSKMLVASTLATWQVGAVAVLAPETWHARELAAGIRQTDIRVALCDARLLHPLEHARDQAHSGADILTFNGGFGEDPDPLEARMAGHSEPATPAATRAEDPAVILLSTSDGQSPVAIAHTHRDCLASADAVLHGLLPLTREDIVAGALAVSAAGGLTGMLVAPLRAGSAVLLAHGRGPEALRTAIMDHRATVLLSNPDFLERLSASSDTEALASLRAVVTMDVGLEPAIWSAFRATVGVGPIAAYCGGDLPAPCLAISDAEHAPGGITRFASGYEARITDDQGACLPTGRVGRLAVRGPSRGLPLDDPHFAETVQDGWRLTDDAFVQGEDGVFRHHGPAKDLIVGVDRTIALSALTHLVSDHALVADCALAVSSDNRQRRRLDAVVVPTDPGHVSRAGDRERLTDAIVSMLRDALEPDGLPVRVRFRTRLSETTERTTPS